MTLTIAIPTMGRPSLQQTLESIARQRLLPGDRVLVVLDTLATAPTDALVEMVERFGPPFELHYHRGATSFFGNPQLNYAIALADTDYFCCLGDDDVFVEGALDRLRASLQPGRVTLFQFLSPHFPTAFGPQRFVLWDQPVLRVAHISGCCLAAPVSALVPVSDEPRCEVDFDWIVAIVEQTRQEPVWLADCLITARPGETPVDTDAWPDVAEVFA